MASGPPAAMKRSASRSSLDLTDAFNAPENEDERISREDIGLRGNAQGGEGVASNAAALTEASSRDAPTIVLPNQRTAAEASGRFALDIGGSLIKLVYFSAGESDATNDLLLPSPRLSARDSLVAGGRLHFCKWETSRVEDAIAFMRSKGMLATDSVVVRATGGGSFKYAQRFSELGVGLKREDEIACLVAGANFLLRAVRDEAYTYAPDERPSSPNPGGKMPRARGGTLTGSRHFVQFPDSKSLYPYLLVNIGSGVSVIKVEGPGQFERVSGTMLGGGTFWGLCKLLTGVENFDEMLSLSMDGHNEAVDLLVGDIYGGHDYAAMGLRADTIASSFGKAATTKGKALCDYRKEDMALALCRMVSYNIGQIAHLTACRYGLTRVFFGGFFIRGHSYTMETISYALNYFSKNEMSAMFLRHEGFLGALGAFLDPNTDNEAIDGEYNAAHGALISERGLRSSSGDHAASGIVERFPVGAPLFGNAVAGPAFGDVSEKVSWVEKFVKVGRAAVDANAADGEVRGSTESLPSLASGGDSADKLDAKANEAAPPSARAAAGGGAMLESSEKHISREAPPPSSPMAKDSTGLNAKRASLAPSDRSFSAPLNVGVLHVSPHLRQFPLLADGGLDYTPDTFDLANDRVEWNYWIDTIADGVSSLAKRACASAGETAEARRRSEAFSTAFTAHLEMVRSDPCCYGRPSLSTILELREECLREFEFSDAYQVAKARENDAAMTVLPGLLKELTEAQSRNEEDLPHLLLEGLLAGNVFDWGAKACVQLYEDGSILDIYKEAQRNLSKPYAVDDSAAFARAWHRQRAWCTAGYRSCPAPWRRAIVFADNAGADVVLGVLPFCRALLSIGVEVVLCANRLPAINDITADEIRRDILPRAGQCADMSFTSAYERGCRLRDENGGRVPAPSTSGAENPVATIPPLYVVDNGAGSPCLDLRRIPVDLADCAKNADLVVIEGMGRSIHTNYNARLRCDTLKVALLKNHRLAQRLLGERGRVFDCVVRFESAAPV